MNKAFLQSEITATWDILSKRGVVPLPNASLAGSVDQAIESCPICAARRACKAASMQRYRDNKASKAKSAKRKKK